MSRPVVYRPHHAPGAVRFQSQQGELQFADTWSHWTMKVGAVQLPNGVREGLRDSFWGGGGRARSHRPPLAGFCRFRSHRRPPFYDSGRNQPPRPAVAPSPARRNGRRARISSWGECTWAVWCPHVEGPGAESGGTAGAPGSPVPLSPPGRTWSLALVGAGEKRWERTSRARTW